MLNVTFLDIFSLLKHMTSKNLNFIKLYDQYSDSIYRFIYFRVHNKDNAWDITQECFLRTLEYINTPQNKINNKRALIYQIARNLIADFWRAQEKQSSQDIYEIQDELHIDTNIEENLDTKMELEELMKYINSLKDHNRDLLLLRYVDGLSFSEIAEILEKNQIALRVQASRLVKNLRLKLK